jgi:hypothetical protein
MNSIKGLKKNLLGDIVNVAITVFFMCAITVVQGLNIP